MNFIKHLLLKARIALLQLRQQDLAAEHHKLQLTIKELQHSEPQLRYRLRQLTEKEIALRQTLINSGSKHGNARFAAN